MIVEAAISFNFSQTKIFAVLDVFVGQFGFDGACRAGEKATGIVAEKCLPRNATVKGKTAESASLTEWDIFILVWRSCGECLNGRPEPALRSMRRGCPAMTLSLYLRQMSLIDLAEV